MSDSKQISERQAQLLRREGYVEGVGAAHADYNAVRQSKQDRGLYAWMETIGAPGLRSHLVKARAAERYPLPRVSRALRGTFSFSAKTWWWTGCAFAWDVANWEDTRQLDEFCQELSTSADYKLLGRMLSGETELVDADSASLEGMNG